MKSLRTFWYRFSYTCYTIFISIIFMINRHLTQFLINRFVLLAVAIFTYFHAVEIFLDIGQHHGTFPHTEEHFAKGDFDSENSLAFRTLADTFPKTGHFSHEFIEHGINFFESNRVSIDPTVKHFLPSLLSSNGRIRGRGLGNRGWKKNRFTFGEAFIRVSPSKAAIKAVISSRIRYELNVRWSLSNIKRRSNSIPVWFRLLRTILMANITVIFFKLLISLHVFMTILKVMYLSAS